ncbi:MAG TPA: hypothetical protein VGF75_03535, partial [Candidatus Saccharimonadales bacterium]
MAKTPYESLTEALGSDFMPVYDKPEVEAEWHNYQLSMQSEVGGVSRVEALPGDIHGSLMQSVGAMEQLGIPRTLLEQRISRIGLLFVDN